MCVGKKKRNLVFSVVMLVQRMKTLTYKRLQSFDYRLQNLIYKHIFYATEANEHDR